MSAPSCRRRAWVVAAILLAGIGCAQVEPPSGGPEDRTVPRLAGMRPDSAAVGVRPDTITLLFSKPMDRPSVRDWTFISPPLPIRERVWPAKNRLDLVLESRPDTGKTYEILFGAEAVDRRKNPLGPLATAFSTGARLDDGTVEGKVIAGKLKAAGAYIYAWDWSESLATSATETPGPLRMAQARTDGGFRLSWLPRNEPLRICALYDASRDRVYDPQDDVWGCIGAPVILADTAGARTGVEIYLVLPDEPGTLKGTAVDSSCIQVERDLSRFARETDSLSAVIGIARGPKAKGLADTLYGFAPAPREEAPVDTVAIRSRLAQVDSLRVLARSDSVRCAVPVIVRLLERDTSLVAEVRGRGPFEFRDVAPGGYRIRGYRDLNGNGLADPDEPAGGLPDSVSVMPGRTLPGLDFPLLRPR